MAEKIGDFVSPSPRSNPRDSNVGTEWPRFSAKSQRMKQRFCLLKYRLRHTPSLTDSNPNHAHFLEVWKCSHPFDLERELSKLHLSKHTLYAIEIGGGYISKKFQR